MINMDPETDYNKVIIIIIIIIVTKRREPLRTIMHWLSTDSLI